MLTSHHVQTTSENQPDPLHIFHPVRHEDISAKKDRLSGAVWAGTRIFAGAVLLFTVNGCLATRSWVDDRLTPINDELAQHDSRLNATDAKADQALAGLQNLHLQRRLVLDSAHGPTFALGSANLTANAKREIDGFFHDLDGSANSGPASERVFVIAGHTDSLGGEGSNYDLGQRRATRVAGYLVGKEGVDPAQLRVVSYGASKPVANNNTSLGRGSNRRVEILVYQEKISTGG